MLDLTFSALDPTPLRHSHDMAAWYGREHSDTPREMIPIDRRVGGRYEFTMVRRENGAKSRSAMSSSS